MTSTRRALALAVIVMTVTMYAGDAFARAGSGGSRGSRSFSRPAAPPASPAAPSSPTRQYGAPAPPAPASRGMLGPLVGGLAGFALGGLLGGLLFGGLGFGGGIGLLDVLLIGVALYLLARVMSARRAQSPAYATAGAYGSARRADEGASRGGGVASVAEAPPETPSELERGLAHVRQMDPAFEPAAVAEAARGLFADVQRGLTARDMSPVSARLTPRMYNELTRQCDQLRTSRRTNRVEQLAIRRAEATEAWQESGQDYLTVYLAGSLVDYTVDDASGAVVEGNRAAQDFEEYWTFARPVGPNRWKLSAIQTV
jgi:predicted lipid-binding transport protein (Tim44 family)